MADLENRMRDLMSDDRLIKVSGTSADSDNVLRASQFFALKNFFEQLNLSFYFYNSVPEIPFDVTVTISDGYVTKLSYRKNNFLDKDVAPINKSFFGSLPLPKKLVVPEEFTELTYLSINYTSIEELIFSELGFGAFTNLKGLNCSNNNISSLVLPYSPNLESLFCDHNRLKSLDFSSIRSLKTINCSDNNIVSLNVFSNENLEVLDCSYNNIVNLNINNNKKLEALSCSNNNLARIDVFCNDELDTLVCYDNPFTDLYVTYNKKLKRLFCDSDVDVIKHWYQFINIERHGE